MVRFWFDAFREKGAPTWYGDNRTPVVVDLQIAALCALFVLPSIAYLIILPGVRRTKLISTVIFLSTMFIGATLVVGVRYPCWQIGSLNIYSTYKAHSNDRMEAILGVKIGLDNVNMTLESIEINNMINHNLNYNERFSFLEMSTMETELSRALRKGLPFPLLKVIEYLSTERSGFNFGRKYRMAGYYTSFCHSLALIAWCFSLVFLCLLPPMFGGTILFIGIMMIIGNITYYSMVPHNMEMRFQSSEGWTKMSFAWGHCFWASLITGTLCIFGGILLIYLQRRKIYRLETVFSTKLHTPKIMMESKYDKPRSVSVDTVESNEEFHSIASSLTKY